MVREKQVRESTTLVRMLCWPHRLQRADYSSSVIQDTKGDKNTALQQQRAQLVTELATKHDDLPDCGPQTYTAEDEN